MRRNFSAQHHKHLNYWLAKKLLGPKASSKNNRKVKKNCRYIIVEVITRNNKSWRDGLETATKVKMSFILLLFLDVRSLSNSLSQRLCKASVLILKHKLRSLDSIKKIIRANTWVPKLHQYKT